jgi:hypothetical protein
VSDEVFDPEQARTSRLLEAMDARMAELLQAARADSDRRRGARAVRATLTTIQQWSQEAAAARLHILEATALEEDARLDVLAEVAGPDGKPVSRQRASQLRKRFRENRKIAEREVAS